MSAEFTTVAAAQSQIQNKLLISVRFVTTRRSLLLAAIIA
jgi:hypothetical protein